MFKPFIYLSNYSGALKNLFFKEATLKCSVNEIINYIKFYNDAFWNDAIILKIFIVDI